MVAEPAPAAPEGEIEAGPAEPEPLELKPTSTPAPPPTETPAPPPQPVADTSIRGRLSQALEALRFRKRASLDKILQLAAKKKSIKNDDVEKLLRVSDATASRYLAQLVKDGKLRRSGIRGGGRYEPV